MILEQLFRILWSRSWSLLLPFLRVMTGRRGGDAICSLRSPPYWALGFSGLAFPVLRCRCAAARAAHRTCCCRSAIRRGAYW